MDPVQSNLSVKVRKLRARAKHLCYNNLRNTVLLCRPRACLLLKEGCDGCTDVSDITGCDHEDVQSDVVPGSRKDHRMFLSVRIEDPELARRAFARLTDRVATVGMSCSSVGCGEGCASDGEKNTTHRLPPCG